MTNPKKGRVALDFESQYLLRQTKHEAKNEF